MPDITFHVNNFNAASEHGNSTLIEHTEGSGLGFYGGAFGISVPVGTYQDTTFVTNSNGTVEDVKCQNTQYTSVSGLSHNTGSEIWNSGTPNYYAPLRIRFSHSEAVRTQNCKLRIFDRNDISKHASGVTTKVYEVRHPHPVYGDDSDKGALDHRGIAHHSWVEFDPTDAPASPEDMVLTPSPGISGLNTVPGETLPTGDGVYYNWVTDEGAAHEAKEHDWYIALSASPQNIGSKTDYALYMTLEYL